MSKVKHIIKTSLKTFEVASGTNLRAALVENGIPLYNGKTETFNCGGNGTCGTCAVQVLDIDEKTSVKDSMKRTSGEEMRLKLPPHFNKNQDIRLACQCQVTQDVSVQKFDGVCGHKFDKTKW
ncbi:predicted protein [Naegleria gruberi]|uniref:Predicted protein n=1 Tax=Naegleria gruberi TaxID=5762 RepID=D2VYU0_NAEGR|nr:uncharacterized protein NAEGRDRAFT_74240 [Naegleria gruberi]EFC37967.1 predicted protein [Naegleria gruberi]|eukprot:XP_002670711.1 predicted protein [Naegleria gruberi strain NEG-M]